MVASPGSARRFERLALRGTPVDVTVISDSNFLLFTPMLAEVASGALEPAHVSAPVRAVVAYMWFRHGVVDEATSWAGRPPVPPGVAGQPGLHTLGYGAAAGLLGGLAFTAVMVLVDALPTVAKLVGARGALAGLVVHLVIAQVIGVSYAVLFRRRRFDLASGLGWGVSYGFVWWVIGGLTLLPLLTTGTPRRGLPLPSPRSSAISPTVPRSGASTTGWRRGPTPGGSPGRRPAPNAPWPGRDQTLGSAPASGAHRRGHADHPGAHHQLTRRSRTVSVAVPPQVGSRPYRSCVRSLSGR